MVASTPAPTLEPASAGLLERVLRARLQTRFDPPGRVVPKVEWHAGELFPHVGFIVTNVTFQLAEVAVPRDPFAAIVERNQWFGIPRRRADDG